MFRTIDLRSITTDLRSVLPTPDRTPSGSVDLVRGIIEQVRTQGDAALVELTERFDGVTLDHMTVSSEAIDAAWQRTPPEVREALQLAHDRVKAFHQLQLPTEHIMDRDGVVIRSFAKPVRRVGCYVPGGRAAYPSTLLMTTVPALVAGVPEVMVCVPPDRATGAVADVTLAAARVAGVTMVVPVGGAQAIAAMAYGTESIAPVDVICGPGNTFVALAKQEVASVVGVAAAFAGPSEIVVVADATAPPDFVAVDLMVQAEHGPDGLAWLVCWDSKVAESVKESLERLVAEAPRRDEIRATLTTSGIAVVCASREQAMEVVNLVAPEHLQLMCEEPEALVPLVDNAGAIFCGPWAPASLGDYVAGPSHVLPTNGSARFSSALTVADFVKHHHVVTASRAGFDALAPSVEVLANAEGLDAHAQSVRIRIDS